MKSTYRNHPKNPANQPFNVTPKPGKNKRVATGYQSPNDTLKTKKD